MFNDLTILPPPFFELSKQIETFLCKTFDKFHVCSQAQKIKKLKEGTLSSEGMTQNVHDRHMQAKEGGEEE